VNARVLRLFESVPLVCLLLTPDIIGFILLTSDIMKRDSKLDLLQGTLDLLILRTLQTGPLHGWAISERIQQISQDVLQVNQGSLYPALHRLEHQGWIKAESGISELGRRARFYRLTASGKKQLELEVDDWERLTVAIGRILEEA
jgi:transcriptional regulator